ncbi:hypothetical protein E4198_14845 [Streptomyces sp. RKND-216]|uniref:hypothetical protein n=1 Tax=Streptomyces sp. RKND-216 TaxID=2562581 RepID=UPI00109DEA72|nr:hypothetical protein [Streptomyces sp. RKND-216]THA25805.1 hypothetical protein E4198_14845 [Streptomyces sp. RKND-216]
MTAENQGTGAPEGDDPFAYLYRQEGGGAEGRAATAPQPGVPRRSYNQVRAVGERQYGGQQTYGGQQRGQATAFQQHGTGSPSAHYAAPETMPGGRAAVRRQGDGSPGGPSGRGRGGRGSGGNRNGLLVVAVAVVAAVVIGIGTAMLFNSDDSGGTGNPQAGTTPTAGAGGEEQDTGGKDEGQKDKPLDLPAEDAAALTLGGKATAANDVPGAQSRNGSYVTMPNAGDSATWSPEVPKAGKYTVMVRYSVPGRDADSTLVVNGDPHDRPLSMKNFANAKKGDWEKGWTTSYSYVVLQEGRNDITVSCEQGNTCAFALDQVWLKPGWKG